LYREFDKFILSFLVGETFFYYNNLKHNKN
jgi:hypothetical protein